ncbi:ATP-binding protein [Massilia solisilvae]|uniref:histidine kinase n=1 Tax=Massilia solisilvae TaxID=1811225 RepID=A0ABT2BHF5_9BURK|nr:ATP-binding protein [Massilia solisilvae]MCS0607861.1 ATP-binding protein [Massilia solisilvae]
MGHVNDEDSGSQQRVPAGSRGEPPQSHAALRAQVESLQQELAVLRVVAREKAELELTAAQLREANQNLVLATVTAQSGRDDAEEANRRQTEFLAMLAHELRNPLAPIGTAAALLPRTAGDDARALELAQVIGRQVAHMAHLLDDLLDAARISSGKITLSLQSVRLDQVIEQAVETVAPRVRERAQELALTLPREPLVLHGDRVRLTQVFTNLLSNASKYTPEGGTIRLTAVADAEQAVVTVQDNGTGIAPGFMPHVFDLFTQGPRALARTEGGLGVGLNVVRNLVGMHGGRIDAYSAGEGEGSLFTVTLPLPEGTLAPPREARTVRRGRAAPLRLLLVEDNRDACETLSHLLALEGHEVQVAYDGKAGLAAATGGEFDALLCDIGLPGLDGLELIACLRRARGGKPLYAVALSGYCQAEDRSRALAAGFDEYCVKPVNTEALLGLLGSRGRAAAPG